MVNPPDYAHKCGKLFVGNLVEITSHLVVVQHNAESDYCEPVYGVTAIDIKNDTITYMDVWDDPPKEKTRTGKIYLFVDKDVIAKLEALQPEGKP